MYHKNPSLKCLPFKRHGSRKTEEHKRGEKKKRLSTALPANDKKINMMNVEKEKKI